MRLRLTRKAMRPNILSPTIKDCTLGHLTQKGARRNLKRINPGEPAAQSAISFYSWLAGDRAARIPRFYSWLAGDRAQRNLFLVLARLRSAQLGRMSFLGNLKALAGRTTRCS